LVRSWQKNKDVEEGFTLVELLVVIVILGVLAAIVVFAVGGISDKGQDSASKTDAGVLEAAQEAYFARQSPGVYTTETNLASGGFVRGISVYNYFCVQVTPVASVNADYYLLPAPIPATQPAADTACSLPANVAAANKALGSTWTGSAGTAAVP
jgi:general secretion pathway protein G